MPSRAIRAARDRLASSIISFSAGNDGMGFSVGWEKTPPDSGRTKPPQKTLASVSGF
jgi:hypothetical protein